MNNIPAANHQRSWAAIAVELKDEAREFFETRIAILAGELREKSLRLKNAVLLLAVGGLLLATAWLLINASLAAAVAHAFSPGPFRWVISFLIVGGVWLLLGAAIAYFAKKQIDPKGLIPVRTVKVLRDDKLWLQREAAGRI
jgi:hypothetical protein